MTDQNVTLARLKKRHMQRINRKAHLWATELQPALREYLLACIEIELGAAIGQSTDQIVDVELTSQSVNIADALVWMRQRGMFS